jgi:hypothetical protein
MQTAATFFNAGWDFVDEAANGIEDIWWILEGKDYLRLWWESSDLLSIRLRSEPALNAVEGTGL